MSQKTNIKIFIASSAELKEEREKCILIINKIRKNHKHLDLEPVEWEYDIVQGNFPGYENIQAGINKTLEECQLVIFLFYSRIGKYTREEFEIATNLNKKIFAYFKDGFTPKRETLQSFSEVLEFKESLTDTVLYKEYKNLIDFELLISDNLNLFFSEAYHITYVKRTDETVSTLSQSNLELIRMLGEKDNEIKELRAGNNKSNDRQIQLQIEKLTQEKESIRTELYQSQEIINQLAQYKQKLELQLGSQKVNDKLKAKALEEVERGNYEEAESYLKQSAKERINDTASTFYELAKIKKLQLQYTEALDYYELSIKVNPDNSDYQNEAGIIAYDLGLFEKAIKYYKKALDIALEYHDDKHPDVAIYYSNIGLAYYCKAEYKKAIQYHEKALKINQANYDENSEEIANGYNNLGLAFNGKGEYERAIQYYEKSSKINLKLYGEESTDIATDYNNIGSAYHNIGAYKKSIEYHKKALEINLKFYDDDSPEIAIDYNNLGSAYNSIGDYDKAIEYHKKALKIDRKYHGEMHQKIATRYNNLGLAYSNKGDYDKAIEYHKKALEIDTEYYGDDHPDIAIDYNNLGVAYYNKDIYNKAIDCYQKSLEIFKKFLPSNHQDIQNAEKNIRLVKQAI
ncbi:tetratricopeptide repeat protein [Panacibacter ginsenosidivorans]|uniref:Tetratricopeptide repeat protein n=1 Tax=Panacibacter ginsenosidivorans TaxID=1813871 RepID=A0A5B8V638_9BACT|nr:tetratricopeptide repeat protein [Panacibacter ginsenosidivorans]QEC66890.1 tetratricopeptide repeat protein [Panacibacter ginsenosidivorans]